MKLRTLAVLSLGLSLNFSPAQAAEATPPEAPVYNITLVNSNTPDFTDIESYLRSITSQYNTPQEKAVAIFHWSHALRKQTAYPTEDGHEVLDPIFFFNNYGYTMCGIISGINNSLFMNMGWKGHYVQLGDHTVGETSWDDGKTWHMFDDSTSIYCFNEKNEVASVREIEKNPKLYLENYAPECGTNPSKGLKDHQAWRFGADHPVENHRTLANGVDSFLPPNEIFEDHLAIRWGAKYRLNLRPNESYTRYFRNLDAKESDPRYYRPLRGKDVEGKINKNARASGVWMYEPNLKDPKTKALVYSDSGVTWTANGITGPGSVVFKVSAANVVTSAKLILKGNELKVSASRFAGTQWTEVELKNNEAELIDAVAGGTEFLIKVELPKAEALLSGFQATTLTQLNRNAMPALVRGPNQIQFRLGAQQETITLVPPVREGQYKKTVSEEKGVACNDKPYFNTATLRPEAIKSTGYVTWKVDAPSPITGIEYGGNITVKGNKNSVTLSHAWDGKTFIEDFKKADGSKPYDKVVNVNTTDTPKDANQVFLKYQFDQGDETWATPGIQTAWISVNHQPRVPGFTPVEVTYCWIEHRESGDVERQHTQVITNPETQYTLNVGGFRDPSMKWLRVNLKGQGPEATGVKVGYSDGEENAAYSKATHQKFTWGTNLALGKPYKLDGKQSDKNPDAGGDLTDGISMPPDTYVSAKWMPTNVIFAPEVSPVATIDLGDKKSISAVRVCGGQADDFHLTYPDTITVETSVDGQTFTKASDVSFNQVFDPPADYLPGECESSSLFDALPAGSRLAYAYRILFKNSVDARYVKITSQCRKGWGVLLSDLQVFDTVKVEDAPPAVVLPTLPLKK